MILAYRERWHYPVQQMLCSYDNAYLSISHVDSGFGGWMVFPIAEVLVCDSYNTISYSRSYFSLFKKAFSFDSGFLECLNLGRGMRLAAPPSTM